MDSVRSAGDSIGGSPLCHSKVKERDSHTENTPFGPAMWNLLV